MVKKKLKIIWDKHASDHLKDIYDYISDDSVQSAQKVKEKILSTIRKLPDNPYMFAQDRFKKNNSGTYRAFIVYNPNQGLKIMPDT
ncbi:MAG: type II toxin-antitoxin system RelE/ParE family toxin [Bacteroidetes bacterium]|nr:type II toxin-antitoxin system RelE/ParE family toxin [Bacteroidota bacterium]MBL7104125.1 type II toxin-antitoxin system RelE/ParE family toxin [Bacteroidales bacterium]